MILFLQALAKVCILSLLLPLVIACNVQEAPQSASATPAPTMATTSESSAYPAGDDSYPSASGASPADMPYPPPSELSEPRAGEQGPRFILNQPDITDTVVTGTAPRNLPLAIVDVTLAGSILGTGRSDGEGNFAIDVSGLRAGNRIGVTVFDATQTMEEWAVEYFDYRGDGFYNAPNIGIFMDTIQVNNN